MIRLLFFIFVLPVLTTGQSISITYEDGDIPTQLGSFDPVCNGPLATLEITLPVGDPVQVTGIDIAYSMTAQGGGFKSHQRSQVHCQNTGITESTVFEGDGDAGGIQNYLRDGVTIANGAYVGGTLLVFEMRAWRTDLNSGCNTTFNKVNNFTWVITVHYEPLAEEGSVGIGTEYPDASALLDLTSAQKGFLPPRMSAALRDAIVDPASGLVVFCTDCTPVGLYHYDGSIWQRVSTTSIMEDADGDTHVLVEKFPDEDRIRFNVGGDEAMIIDDVGRVGIGTSTPMARMSVVNGAILASGFQGGPTPVSGPGTRMMWIPDKGAFRSGNIFGAQWDDENIGIRSFVGGGDNNTASGVRSFIGGGIQNTASAFESFVGGGVNNTASGSKSFIGGGQHLFARSSSEAVFGTFNTDYTPVFPGGFNSNDRLFVIGNGTNLANRSNAVTILKNANVGIGNTASIPAIHLAIRDNGNGLHRPDANVLAFHTNGQERVRVTSIGQLGIGTSVPVARLHTDGGAVLFSGVTGGTPVSGAGTRLMWIPAKAATAAHNGMMQILAPVHLSEGDLATRAQG